MQREILELLADGAFHSGVDLAAATGVSRTSVWKQISAIEQLGLEVHKVRGRGYLIPGGIELLAGEEIAKRLHPEALARFGLPHVFMDVDSTNRVAMDAASGGQYRYVCFAERQGAGRGRRGRDWVSPFGCNLYFSLVQSFNDGFSGMEGLSLAVGLGVIRALQAEGVSGVGLKWPNDIVARGKKLGGILIEVSGDVAGDCQAVIGVGLNLRMPATAGKRIDQEWANLENHAEAALGRNALGAAVLNQLALVMKDFEVYGFAALVPEWNAVDVLRDMPVRVSGAKEVGGVCRGVDEKGGLRLETEHGQQVFYGGEVSLRAET